jgi:hypothetical protein
LIGGVAAGSAIGGVVIGPAGVSGPFLLACGATAVAAAIAFGFRGLGREPGLAGPSARRSSSRSPGRSKKNGW